MKKLIGIKELSANLGISENTLRQWTHMRKIPHYKIGGLVRFDADQIDRWIEKKKRKTFDRKEFIDNLPMR